MTSDRRQPVFGVKTQEQSLSESVVQQRLNLFLIVSLAAAALPMALIGIPSATPDFGVSSRRLATHAALDMAVAEASLWDTALERKSSRTAGDCRGY